MIMVRLAYYKLECISNMGEKIVDNLLALQTLWKICIAHVRYVLVHIRTMR